MNKKKKQHYVWRHYLKPWANSDMIYCLREGKIFASNLMGVANSRFFYKAERLTPAEVAMVRRLAVDPVSDHLKVLNEGWIDTFSAPFQIIDLLKKMDPKGIETEDLIGLITANFEEDIHSRIESTALKYLEAIQNGDVSFYRKDNDTIDFLLFLCTQYMRTKKIQESVFNSVGGFIDGLRIDVMWKVMRHMYANNMGWSLFARRVDWRLLLLETSEVGSTFISGDQPVVNTYAMHQPANTIPDELEFYYPVSPTLALLVTRNSTHVEGSRLKLRPDEVDNYNMQIFCNSHEQVYGNTSEVLEKIALQSATK